MQQFLNHFQYPWQRRTLKKAVNDDPHRIRSVEPRREHRLRRMGAQKSWVVRVSPRVQSERRVDEGRVLR